MKSDKCVCNVATGEHASISDMHYIPYALLFLSITLTMLRSFVLTFFSEYVNHATNMVKGVYEFPAFFFASSWAYVTGCIDQYWLRAIVKNSVHSANTRSYMCMTVLYMMEMKQHGLKSKLFFFLHLFAEYVILCLGFRITI